MRITKQAKRNAKQLFTRCRVDGQLDPQRVRQAVQLLVERKPRGYLPVLVHFARLVKLDLARRSARVESAVALPAPLQQALAANLTRRYGPGLDFAFTVNPALIGGARIQVGSDVYDGSVLGRLVELSQKF